MDKKELRYEDFIEEVTPVYRDFVNRVHDFFLQNGCKIKIEMAKNGYVVSYSHVKTKRVVANFVFRKGGLVIRIYGDNLNGYAEFFDTLPEGMIKSIEKAPVCKRLMDPTKCNSRCPMGYDFSLKNQRYQKCRYNCFMFAVNDESIPYIKAFLEKEIKERTEKHSKQTLRDTNHG